MNWLNVSYLIQLEACHFFIGEIFNSSAIEKQSVRTVLSKTECAEKVLEHHSDADAIEVDIGANALTGSGKCYAIFGCQSDCSIVNTTSDISCFLASECLLAIIP